MTTAITLQQGFTLKNGTYIKNRLFKSAMSEQLSDAKHNPLPGLATLYHTWALGGLGLSVTGNLMVDRNALGEPKQVVLDEQSDLTEFKRWAQQGSVNDTQLWAQLNHPGKQTPNFINAEPVAPSAIALTNGLEKGFNTPRALTESEILNIIRQFQTSAKLAKKVGFTGVQIHGAHGYLVNQFLSPRHNQRDDQWGGSIENRMRFVLSIYQAIRTEVGDEFPIGIKLNSADFMRGGFTEEESMQVVKALSDAGIDQIEISGGTYESPTMTGHKVKKSTLTREAYFLAYAEKVRAISDTPLVVTGGFRSSKAMLSALQSNATDFIGLARPMSLDTQLPNKLMASDDHKIRLPHLTTGVKAIDRIAMLDITWYEAQLARIAKQQQPKANLGTWPVFFKTIYSAGSYAFRKRRA
ncbi:NADH:flavin oxidoreductase/NADH oxidase family protein [Moritella viscosa]|uniref:NADH oxidase n=1 Tax=Moritella viscosa TaxID=80854 RepID=A0ABY1HI55_9GAMM|nr:NADH:flavin oxidoreductase/NADH oxidase family protein [Moritella viscosa]SGY94132.1 NADH oxidase [Moritella viscosa]SGZ05702.1 NADH oxidase [Moritella viscosa]SHO26805.1 NADH oxidase [Moritella viscosa]